MNVLLASGLDSFLGTVWWSAIVFVIGWGLGVVMADRVKSMLGR